MGKTKGSKQDQKPRERFCQNCNATKAVQNVKVLGEKTAWKNLCLTCNKYTDS